VVESAEREPSDDLAAAGCGRREARGEELADPLVSASTVEVARVLRERLEQVGGA